MRSRGFFLVSCLLFLFSFLNSAPPESEFYSVPLFDTRLCHSVPSYSTFFPLCRKFALWFPHSSGIANRLQDRRLKYSCPPKLPLPTSLFFQRSLRDTSVRVTPTDVIAVQEQFPTFAPSHQTPLIFLLHRFQKCLMFMPFFFFCECLHPQSDRQLRPIA